MFYSVSKQNIFKYVLHISCNFVEKFFSVNKKYRPYI